MAEWTDAFFDLDYLWLYERALPAERTEAEAAGVWSLSGLREGRRLLDVACGQGRIAVPLARRGAAVTGVDRSEPLLARARTHAAQVGVALELVRADMRALPFGRSAFEAATMVYSSLGYGSDEDALATLRGVREALAPGGRLVLDVVHRDRYVRDFAASREWYEVAGRIVLCEREFDPIAGEERARFRWEGSEKNFRLRLYTATEVWAMARAGGFADVRLFGGYDGEPFRHDSPLLVAVLR